VKESLPRIGLALALAILGGRSGSAFESEEHRRVSALGLRLAVCIVEHDLHLPETKALEVRRAMDELRDAVEPVEAEWSAAQSYGRLVELVDYEFSPLERVRLWKRLDGAPRRASDLDRDYLAAAHDDVLLKFLAMHLNAEHFQDKLLKAFWWWHRSAIHEAVHGELFTAILMSSYADHFLQDFFAPGHIATPRADLHDLAAVALHDRYNAIGATVRVRRRSELLELLERCSAQEIRFAGELAAIEAHLKGESPDLEVFGDGLIDRTAGQAGLIAIVEARSLLDVFEAFALEAYSNSFEEIGWISRTTEAVDRGAILRAPEASIPYVEYVRESPIYTFGLTAGLTIGADLLFSPDRDRGGWRGEVESLVFGVPPKGNFWRDHASGKALSPLPQFGLALGYTAVTREGSVRHGPMLRTIFPIRKIDSQLSAGVALRARNWSSLAADELEPFVRWEMGFGVVFLFSSLGYERPGFEDGDGRELVLSSGISLVFPMTRLARGRRS
jgi:hypothetical protein